MHSRTNASPAMAASLVSSITGSTPSARMAVRSVANPLCSEFSRTVMPGVVSCRRVHSCVTPRTVLRSIRPPTVLETKIASLPTSVNNSLSTTRFVPDSRYMTVVSFAPSSRTPADGVPTNFDLLTRSVEFSTAWTPMLQGTDRDAPQLGVGHSVHPDAGSGAALDREGLASEVGRERADPVTVVRAGGGPERVADRFGLRNDDRAREPHGCGDGRRDGRAHERTHGDLDPDGRGRLDRSDNDSPERQRSCRTGRTSGSRLQILVVRKDTRTKESR